MGVFRMIFLPMLLFIFLPVELALTALLLYFGLK
jgi:hypothetical protein